MACMSLLRGPLQNRKSLARRINNLFPVSSKKNTATYSHTIKLFPKYGEDWMKNVIYRRDILKMVQKHWNSDAAHAHKALPFSDTNQLGLGNYEQMSSVTA